MSEQRQAVDFLRRRYAAAIMQDDMDTACRLRLQLDAIMNRVRLGYPPYAGTPVARADPAPSPSDGAAESTTGPVALRLLVTTPVTGLLESRR